MKAATGGSESGLLVAYYAATGVFLLLDYALNINVRLAFLEPYPDWRIAYYGFCFACLGVIIWRPALASIVAMVESLVTLVALILTMAIRSMIITDEMIETGVGGVTMPEMINFMLAGGVAYYVWASGMKNLKNPP